MHCLSEPARLIIDRMAPDRRYGPYELQAFVPGVTLGDLREIMHELWIGRQVERVGYSGWRRARSMPPHQPEPVTRETHAVKPEELFDHAAFADFFK